MNIFVVINDDGDPQKALKTREEAEDYCKDCIEYEDPSLIDEWDCYYRIYEVELK